MQGAQIGPAQGPDHTQKLGAGARKLRMGAMTLWAPESLSHRTR